MCADGSEHTGRSAWLLHPKPTNAVTLLSDILKCIIFTEVSMLGSFIMFSYPWSIGMGFAIWGAVIALMCAMVLAWGGLFGNSDNEITMVVPIAILNAIGVNMGGYLVLMLMLKMPIAGVVYV